MCRILVAKKGTSRSVAGRVGRLPVAGRLIGLLSADELNVHATPALSLQVLTDKDFAYAAYETLGKPDAVIAKWKTWLATKATRGGDSMQIHRTGVKLATADPDQPMPTDSPKSSPASNPPRPPGKRQTS